MKHIDTDQLESLNSIQTPRKKTINHSKKPRGTSIGPPGSTLPGVQNQNSSNRNISSFGIPSIKSTQTKRTSSEYFKRNHSSRKKRITQNTFLDLASERQRVDHYNPNNYYDDKCSWRHEPSEVADTKSNRKRGYGRQWNHDRTKRDHSPHAKTSHQSYEWDDRKNYSLERKHIEIDLYSEEEQEDQNHQKVTPPLHNGADIGRDKNQHHMEEQDPEHENVESIQKNTCHSNRYTVNEEDHQVYSLNGDSDDEKPSHEQQSSFSTAAIKQRLKGSKTASNMKGVVENIKDRRNSRGTKSRDEQIWTVPKVNNARPRSIPPVKTYLRNRESIESADSDELFPMIGKAKETSDEDYTPKKVSSSSKKKSRIGEKAIQRVKEKTTQFVKTLTEWSSSPTRVTRSSSSKKRKQEAKEEVIILSSDDDESLVNDSSLCDESEIGSPVQIRSSARKLRFGDRPRITAQRLAIGSKVFKNVSFSVSTAVRRTDLILEYQKSNGENMKHRFSCKDVNHAHFYIPDQNNGSSTEDEEPDANKKVMAPEESKHELAYLIFRAPSKGNAGFDKFSNSYLDDASFEELEKKRNGGTAKENEKRFIALEFVYTEEFQQFFNRFKTVLAQNGEDLFATLLTAGELRSHQKDEYILPLLKSARKFRNGTRFDDDSMQNIKDDEIMLVFPFPESRENLDLAAKDMNEASFLGDANSIASSQEIVQGKTHMVTIRGEDYKRLVPMEFLNDTLIDFWMKWITRMEPGPSQSKIHIFTTQFYSALEDNGVDAVTKWTARKDIDIFDKKFILIPINKDLHWSLCIVVNPGKIPNGDKILPNMNNIEESMELDAPLLILMDSLRMHRKGRIQSHIYAWLNSEAKRLGKFEDLKTEAGIFNKRTMPMFDPHVPRQENSWDCGVFVCRYGFAIYRLYLEGMEFKVRGAINRKEYQTQLNKLISSHQAFNFNMDDIERIRVEMKELLKNLNVLYTKWRKREKISKRKKQEEIESKALAVYASKANSIGEQQI